MAVRIAQLAPTLFASIGGLQVCVHNISVRLAAQGHEVTAFTPFSPAMPVGYAVSPFPRFRMTWLLHPLSRLWIGAWVRKTQARFGFDLWQVNGGWPFGAVLAPVFERLGIPAVLRCSGDDIQKDERFGYGVRRDPRIDAAIRRSYPRFAACVAITETVRDEYLGLGVDQERVTLIPNGVDFARVRNAAPDFDLRVRHGIPAGRRILLSVGRNHPKKGYSLIPGALATLNEAGCDVHWVVVGPGASEVAQEASQAGFGDRLTAVEEISFGRGFDVPSDELVGYYRQADLFVMPSLLETFGIVLLEAMAAGLPVACFNVPGVRDVMRPELGRICPAGDACALGLACASLLHEPSGAMRDACLAQAQAHDWDVVTGAYRELYRRLAG